jgi:hypothetical protein
MQHPSWVYRCRFSPDGSLLATASYDAKCRIWDLHSGDLNSRILAHPREVYDATFTPNGRWVLTACRDGAVRIWETQTGEMICAPYKAGEQAFRVEVTADGQYALVGSLSDAIHIICLAALGEPIQWDSDALVLVAEVVSGSALQQGMVCELGTADWLQRYHQLHESYGDLADAVWAQMGFQVPEKRCQVVKQETSAGSPETLAVTNAPCNTCTTACLNNLTFSERSAGD